MGTWMDSHVGLVLFLAFLGIIMGIAALTFRQRRIDWLESHKGSVFDDLNHDLEK